MYLQIVATVIDNADVTMSYVHLIYQQSLHNTVTAVLYSVACQMHGAQSAAAR